MTTILIANVGNRDVLLRGQEKSPYPPRPEGEKLFQQYQAVKETLTFPILDPCLDFVLAQENHKIDRLVLVGTDQPAEGDALKTDKFGVPFRDKDTLHFARLIERRYRESRAGQLGKIGVMTVRANPALYDEAMVEYGKLVGRLARADYTACYVVTAGGTPACNVALLLQAVRCFGEKCRTVYLPEEGEPYELSVGRQMLDAFREATVLDYLAACNFEAALPLLEKLQLEAGCLALASYARRRLYFDFDAAQQALLDGLRQSMGALRQFLDSLRHDLDPLRARQPQALLRELYFNALITYAQGRYVDFVGRMFRFEEGLARYVVEQEYGVTTHARDGKAAFTAFVEANPCLRSFIVAPERARGGRPLDYGNMTIPVWMALIERLALEGRAADTSPLLSQDRRTTFGQLYAILQRVEKLSHLRNSSIIAHDYDPVSREIITSGYNEGCSTSFDPLADMAAALDYMGLEIGENPFERIGGFLQQRVRRNS
jgi:hypothetical protein